MPLWKLDPAVPPVPCSVLGGLGMGPGLHLGAEPQAQGQRAVAGRRRPGSFPRSSRPGGAGM